MDILAGLLYDSKKREVVLVKRKESKFLKLAQILENFQESTDLKRECVKFCKDQVGIWLNPDDVTILNLKNPMYMNPDNVKNEDDIVTNSHKEPKIILFLAEFESWQVDQDFNHEVIERVSMSFENFIDNNNFQDIKIAAIVPYFLNLCVALQEIYEEKNSC